MPFYLGTWWRNTVSRRVDCGHHHAREPASGTAAQRRRDWKEKKSGFAVSGLAIERHHDGLTTSGRRGGGESKAAGGSVRFEPQLIAEGGVGGVTHTFLPCRSRDPPGSSDTR